MRFVTRGCHFFEHVAWLQGSTSLPECLALSLQAGMQLCPWKHFTALMPCAEPVGRHAALHEGESRQRSVVLLAAQPCVLDLQAGNQLCLRRPGKAAGDISAACIASCRMTDDRADTQLARARDSRTLLHLQFAWSHVQHTKLCDHQV